MSPFERPDLVPLWDRPPSFLPRRPPAGCHHWPFAAVERELRAASTDLDPGVAERRVALLAHPGLDLHQAADGLHAGIQLLLPGESAPPHRHTPAALRVGLGTSGAVTVVNDVPLALDPLDVVLNPSGTWHGHVDRGGDGAIWLDVVDLPIVAALGAVLFEPSDDGRSDGLLDPPSVPATTVYPWTTAEAALLARPAVDGVRTHPYTSDADETRPGDHARPAGVLPTLAVTAHLLDEGATLRLPRRSCGAVALAARGAFIGPPGPIVEHDVVGLRGWTPLELTATEPSSVVIIIDTTPAVRALQLYREAPASAESDVEEASP